MCTINRIDESASKNILGEFVFQPGFATELVEVIAPRGRFQRGFLHPRLIVFAFGVKQRDFGHKNVWPPWNWAAHDIKSDMPPDDRSRVFGTP
jgi:hypothetical protein